MKNQNDGSRRTPTTASSSSSSMHGKMRRVSPGNSSVKINGENIHMMWLKRNNGSRKTRFDSADYYMDTLK